MMAETFSSFLSFVLGNKLAFFGVTKFETKNFEGAQQKMMRQATSFGQKQKRSNSCGIKQGLPDVSWDNIPTQVKIFQNGGKYTK
jgi:hypothetical protein